MGCWHGCGSWHGWPSPRDWYGPPVGDPDWYEEEPWPVRLKMLLPIPYFAGSSWAITFRAKRSMTKPRNSLRKGWR